MQTDNWRHTSEILAELGLYDAGMKEAGAACEGARRRVTDDWEDYRRDDKAIHLDPPPLGEVQEREVPEEDANPAVVCQRGLMLRGVAADMDFSPSKLGLCTPPFGLAVPAHPFEPRGAFKPWLIDIVFALGRQAEVREPIIQLVPVDVIDDAFRPAPYRKRENYSVDKHARGARDLDGRVAPAVLPAWENISRQPPASTSKREQTTRLKVCADDGPHLLKGELPRIGARGGVRGPKLRLVWVNPHPIHPVSA